MFADVMVFFSVDRNLVNVSVPLFSLSFFSNEKCVFVMFTFVMNVGDGQMCVYAGTGG